MNWQRSSKYIITSDCGYSIAAVQCGGVWVFGAFGPKRSSKNIESRTVLVDPLLGELVIKSSYQIGEPVPESNQFLGQFRSDRYQSADDARVAAKEACQEHHNQVLALQLSKQSTGPSDIAAIRTR